MKINKRDVYDNLTTGQLYELQTVKEEELKLIKQILEERESK